MLDHATVADFVNKQNLGWKAEKYSQLENFDHRKTMRET